MPDAATPLLAADVSAPAGYRVFIDFDNTISRGDVLDGLIERFAADEGWHELEDEWAAGRIGARACLDGQMRMLRGTWPQIQRHLDGVVLDPGFGELRDLLRREQVDLAIVSDNFDLFIAAILRRCGLADVPVFANHVEFAGDLLQPSFPYYNPDCPGCAHCKKTHFVPRGPDRRRVVYIGDGQSDLCPARHADIVFAKASLLSHLQQEGISCHAFDHLTAVASTLQKLLHETHR
ncbi:MAG: MtnX-like HAD-IB family phosphatase [Opitutales bacterium]